MKRLFVSLFCLACQLTSQSVFALTLDMVTVGNPGNAADTTVMVPDGTSGYGSVDHVYFMGKYDVTVGQYVEFLNAVATTSDPYGLYDSHMTQGNFFGFPTFGISQNVTLVGFKYVVTGSSSQAANVPIFDITWDDAARFCNWLQNGQPTGVAEGAGTTETGAYTLNGHTANADLMAVNRNANATYFIPSENEWYKAAYYDPTLNNGAGGYWKYPTKSNTTPGNTLPDTGNHANYYVNGYTDSTNYLTPVGSFNLSPGPYGTYDMGGDVLQWNEAKVTSTSRGLRGGAYDEPGFHVFYPSSFNLASENRDYYNFPTSVNPNVGFRVASLVPEPSTILLLGIGAISLLGYRNLRTSGKVRLIT
jgi:sulfatase modifying factor 1